MTFKHTIISFHTKEIWAVLLQKIYGDPKSLKSFLGWIKLFMSDHLFSLFLFFFNFDLRFLFKCYKIPPELINLHLSMWYIMFNVYRVL